MFNSNVAYCHCSAVAVLFKNRLYLKHASCIIIILLKLKTNHYKNKLIFYGNLKLTFCHFRIWQWTLPTCYCLLSLELLLNILLDLILCAPKPLAHLGQGPLVKKSAWPSVRFVYKRIPGCRDNRWVSKANCGGGRRNSVSTSIGPELIGPGVVHIVENNTENAMSSRTRKESAIC